MGKTVCSLVLNQAVLDKVDRESILKNVSRSQVINDILCEYYHVATPDVKMMRVMELLMDAMQAIALEHQSAKLTHGLTFVSATPGNTLQMRTTVAFKYSPQLKYVLELTGKDSDQLAVLKIYSRTVSAPFLHALIMFFNYLTDFEEAQNHALGHRAVSSSGYAFEDNKFIRGFFCEWTDKSIQPELISQYLSNYIQFVDEAMKVFFNNPSNWKVIDQQMTALYKKYW